MDGWYEIWGLCIRAFWAYDFDIDFVFGFFDSDLQVFHAKEYTLWPKCSDLCTSHPNIPNIPTSNQATEHLILFRKTTTMTTTQWQSKCIYALIHVAIDRKSRGVPIYGYCIPNRMKRMNECLISLLYLLLRMSVSFSLRPYEFYAKITLNALRLYAWKTPPTPYSTQTYSTAF